MMNRYIGIAILLLFSSLSHFFIDDHLQVKFHHESMIVDNQSSDDSSQMNNDTPKIINFTLFSIIFMILSLTKSNTFVYHLTKKKIFLTPIFYQSNYVKESPLYQKILHF